MHTTFHSRLPSARVLGLQLPALASALLLAGCALPSYQRVQLAEDEASVIQGPSPRHNGTPLDGALACLSHRIVAGNPGKAPLSIAVGDIKDYTGKYSTGDGNVLTQGGALMVYSALGKLGGAVDVRERFDTRVAELELAYTDRRQLGDGNQHPLADGKGQRAVPWLPYYGGSILKSDYYIIGGLTELNYNIQSGGIEAQVNQIGPRFRVFTMNVGADLRIVETVGRKMIVQGFAHQRMACRAIHLRAARRNDRQLVCEQSVDMKIIERGKQHTLRKVARCAEQDQGLDFHAHLGPLG